MHAHYGLSGWAASWQSLPLVVTFAGSDLYPERRGGLRDRWRGRGEVVASHWAALRARQLIVVSPRMLDLLKLRSLRSKATVLPYGIDTKQFSPGSPKAARQHFGLDPDAFVILWPHSDSPTKRRDIAEAASVRRGETHLRQDLPSHGEGRRRRTRQVERAALEDGAVEQAPSPRHREQARDVHRAG